MNIIDFLQRVWRNAGRFRMNLDFGLGDRRGMFWDTQLERPPHNDEARRYTEGPLGIRAAVRRRSNRGFVGDDVRISMYLGTRGGRSF